MAESKRGKQLQKGGADIPVGKLKLGGVAVTATAAELNKVAGSGATVASGTTAGAITHAAETAAPAGAINVSANDADGAKLADVQALRTVVNQLVTDVGVLVTKLNAVMDATKGFNING